MTRRLLFVLLVPGVALMWGASAFAAHSDHGCENCHVPHKALEENEAEGIWGVPLYSPAQVSDGLPTFTLYSSSTLDASLGQPDGPSKLCLGCHDGSYFVFGFVGHGRVFQSDTDPLGEMALTTSHPVSFVYDPTLATNDGELNNPVTASSNTGSSKTIDEELLDSRHKMQCSSCHDVHVGGIGEELLRWDVSGGDQDMCRTCHVK